MQQYFAQSSFGGSPQTQFKKNAYLDYLKTFSQDGIVTLDCLQEQFNIKVNQKINIKLNIFNDSIYPQMQTLLSAYQLLILEINDSCEFSQIKQFGKFIVKIFVQLTKILRWSFKQSLSLLKLIQKIQSKMVSRTTRYSGFSQEKYNQQNIFINQNNKKFKNVQFQVKERNKHGRCSQNILLKQQKLKNISFQTPRSSVIKQKIPFQLRDFDQQIRRIQTDYKDQISMKKQKQIGNQTIVQRIQKMNKIGSQVNSSNKQQIINEIMLTLNAKCQAIEKFATSRTNNIIQNLWMNQNTPQYYEKMKSQLTNQVNNRLQTAKAKLSHLFKQNMIRYETQRINSEILKKKQFQTQVNEQIIIQAFQSSSQLAYQTKFRQKLILKKLKQEIKILEYKVQYEKSLKQKFQKLLKDKAIKYEEENLNFRNQLINIECRNRKQLRKLMMGQKFSQNNSNSLGALSKLFQSQLSIEESQKINILNRKQNQSISQQHDIMSQFKTNRQFSTKRNLKSKSNNKFTFLLDYQSNKIHSNILQVQFLPQNKQQKRQNQIQDQVRFAQKAFNTSKQEIKNQLVDNSTQTCEDYISANIQKLNAQNKKKAQPTKDSLKLTDDSSWKNIQFDKNSFNLNKFSTKSNRLQSANKNNYLNRTVATSNRDHPYFSDQTSLFSRIMKKFDQQCNENPNISKNRLNFIKMNKKKKTQKSRILITNTQKQNTSQKDHMIIFRNSQRKTAPQKLNNIDINLQQKDCKKVKNSIKRSKQKQKQRQIQNRDNKIDTRNEIKKAILKQRQIIRRQIIQKLLNQVDPTQFTPLSIYPTKDNLDGEVNLYKMLKKMKAKLFKKHQN